MEAGWGWWCALPVVAVAALALRPCRPRPPRRPTLAPSPHPLLQVHIVPPTIPTLAQLPARPHDAPPPLVMSRAHGAGEHPPHRSPSPPHPPPPHWYIPPHAPRLELDPQPGGTRDLGSARSPSLEKDDRSPCPAPMATPAGDGTPPPHPQTHTPPCCGGAGAGGRSRVAKFEFSPRLLSDSFFTPPENISPMFFAEPSPKSVYYDSVRSPKFFPETPRTEAEAPQSPRALGDHCNRNHAATYALSEKPTSPRILATKPRSPKVHSRNKENYFTFDPAALAEEGDAAPRLSPRLSPRPRRYGGRSSIERERYTPPIDRDARKYHRHNSCDTNFKNVEINISKLEGNPNAEEGGAWGARVSGDVVDCCAKLESIDIECRVESPPRETPVADHLTTSHSSSAQSRRQRLKSISLDSDNAKIIELNLGLPIAKQMKDQMNQAYKHQDVSTSCHNMDRDDQFKPAGERPVFEFDPVEKEPEEAEEPKSPDLIQRKSLRHSSDTQSFLDMPRFSPKELEITVTSEEGATTSADAQGKKKGSKNLRNLTIDLTKRDSELEKELLEFEKLYTNAEEKKVKTPTLKVKATSLDSSESVNLSLPQKKTLDVPQNSVSVPNTPKRQMKRILAQKKMNELYCGGKMGYNSLQYSAEQRKMFLKGQDSGIFLRENHANLMLYQPGTSRMGSRTMGSFDENISDFAENAPEINISNAEGRHLPHDAGHMLGSNLLNYKQSLSVSSTNLKTLPEGVPSDDFEPTAEDEVGKKLFRRNSNQSLMYTAHSLQSSNCSLTSASNYSLNVDKTPPPRACLLQRRGSNHSLTLNLQCHSSHGSLPQRKGLLERRGSTASLTLDVGLSRADKACSAEELARNITTEPLSPRTTTDEFRLYLANLHRLQTAGAALSRARLRDLAALFDNGYTQRTGGAAASTNPQCALPDLRRGSPCTEHQKTLLRSLHHEFWDMPTNFQEKPLVSGSHCKNRYKSILPNEHSRVILRDRPDIYINANYIKGHESTKNSYIATQGPLQNTIYDFWLMVNQNCRDAAPLDAPPAAPPTQKVVMLTNFVENNRQKCERYFPLEPGEEMAVADPDGGEGGGSFRILTTGLVTKLGYNIRRLCVRRGDSEDSITVYHYWFHNWADHKCPQDVSSLLELSLEVLAERPPSFPAAEGEVAADGVAGEAPAVVVHCSAGIGRTGCLIAILSGIRQLRAEGKVDVLGIVCNMRLDRGGMVQNSEQYELVHKVLCLYERVACPGECGGSPPPPDTGRVAM